MGLVAIVPTAVIVADGRKLCCDHKCPGLKWRMRGHEFKFDLRMLELGGFCMILGVDWLKIHNPVLLDFEVSSITITKQQKPLLLLGIGEESLQYGLWYSGNSCIKRGWIFKLLYFVIGILPQKKIASIKRKFLLLSLHLLRKRKNLNQLLQQSQVIFEEPQRVSIL